MLSRSKEYGPHTTKNLADARSVILVSAGNKPGAASSEAPLRLIDFAEFNCRQTSNWRYLRRGPRENRDSGPSFLPSSETLDTPSDWDRGCICCSPNCRSETQSATCFPSVMSATYRKQSAS